LENNEMILDRVLELYENVKLWRDPYDSEDYNNRYIRKLSKICLYFIPDFMYKTGLNKPHIWSENYGLIGKCFLKLGEVSLAEQIYYDLINLSEEKYYWGLPIEWKSGKNVFPKGVMMSTTTSEIALFFVELNKYSNVVTKDILEKIAYNLLKGLNRVFEDDCTLILGYTAYDEYRVINSNLLVAAALHEIGIVINDQNLISSSIKITNACINGISENGGVPYFMNGSIYDSYHQVFSLRALEIMKNESTEYKKTFDNALFFLKNELMDSKGNVYLSPKKDIIDMQGSAEALGFLSVNREKQLADKVLKQIDLILKNKKGKYVQRVWLNKMMFSLKSKTIFTRQGELRLLLSKLQLLGEKND